jgi:cell wall-associated NlpC family hydrolase
MSNRVKTWADIVTAARGYVDAPWRHQGRSLTQGVDCIGLVVCASRAAGVDGGDFRLYGPEPDPKMLLREAGKLMDRLDSREQLVAGSVVVFKLSLQGPPQHFGILTDAGTLIHTYTDLRKVGEVTYGRTWRKLTVAGFNFRGFDYEGAPQAW